MSTKRGFFSYKSGKSLLPVLVISLVISIFLTNFISGNLSVTLENESVEVGESVVFLLYPVTINYSGIVFYNETAYPLDSLMYRTEFVGPHTAEFILSNETFSTVASLNFTVTQKLFENISEETNHSLDANESDQNMSEEVIIDSPYLESDLNQTENNTVDIPLEDLINSSDSDIVNSNDSNIINSSDTIIVDSSPNASESENSSLISVATIQEEIIVEPTAVEVITAGLEQGEARVGEPVSWRTKIELASEDSLMGTELLIQIPSDDAVWITNFEDTKNTSEEETTDSLLTDEEVQIQSLSDLTTAKSSLTLEIEDSVLKEEVSFTSLVVNSSNTEVVVEGFFTTSAPKQTEKMLSDTDGFVKEVIVSSDAPIHYYNVLAGTSIPPSLAESVQVIWYDEGIARDITSNPQFNVSLIDTDADGFVDKVTFIVPQLSTQRFVVVSEQLTFVASSSSIEQDFWEVEFLVPLQTTLGIEANPSLSLQSFQYFDGVSWRLKSFSESQGISTEWDPAIHKKGRVRYSFSALDFFELNFTVGGSKYTVRSDFMYKQLSTQFNISYPLIPYRVCSLNLNRTSCDSFVPLSANMSDILRIPSKALLDSATLSLSFPASSPINTITSQFAGSPLLRSKGSLIAGTSSQRLFLFEGNQQTANFTSATGTINDVQIYDTINGSNIWIAAGTHIAIVNVSGALLNNLSYGYDLTTLGRSSGSYNFSVESPVNTTPVVAYNINGSQNLSFYYDVDNSGSACYLRPALQVVGDPGDLLMSYGENQTNISNDMQKAFSITSLDKNYVARIDPITNISVSLDALPESTLCNVAYDSAWNGSGMPYVIANQDRINLTLTSSQIEPALLPVPAQASLVNASTNQSQEITDSPSGDKCVLRTAISYLNSADFDAYVHIGSQTYLLETGFLRFDNLISTRSMDVDAQSAIAIDANYNKSDLGIPENFEALSCSIQLGVNYNVDNEQPLNITFGEQPYEVNTTAITHNRSFVAKKESQGFVPKGEQQDNFVGKLGVYAKTMEIEIFNFSNLNRSAEQCFLDVSLCANHTAENTLQLTFGPSTPFSVSQNLSDISLCQSGYSNISIPVSCVAMTKKSVYLACTTCGDDEYYKIQLDNSTKGNTFQINSSIITSPDRTLLASDALVRFSSNSSLDYSVVDVPLDCSDLNSVSEFIIESNEAYNILVENNTPLINIQTQDASRYTVTDTLIDCPAAGETVVYSCPNCSDSELRLFRDESEDIVHQIVSIDLNTEKIEIPCDTTSLTFGCDDCISYISMTDSNGYPSSVSSYQTSSQLRKLGAGFDREYDTLNYRFVPVPIDCSYTGNFTFSCTECSDENYYRLLATESSEIPSYVGDEEINQSFIFDVVSTDPGATSLYLVAGQQMIRAVNDELVTIWNHTISGVIYGIESLEIYAEYPGEEWFVASSGGLHVYSADGDLIVLHEMDARYIIAGSSSVFVLDANLDFKACNRQCSLVGTLDDALSISSVKDLEKLDSGKFVVLTAFESDNVLVYDDQLNETISFTAPLLDISVLNNNILGITNNQINTYSVNLPSYVEISVGNNTSTIDNLSQQTSLDISEFVQEALNDCNDSFCYIPINITSDGRAILSDLDVQFRYNFSEDISSESFQNALMKQANFEAGESMPTSGLKLSYNLNAPVQLLIKSLTGTASLSNPFIFMNRECTSLDDPCIPIYVDVTRDFDTFWNKTPSVVPVLRANVSVPGTFNVTLTHNYGDDSFYNISFSENLTDGYYKLIVYYNQSKEPHELFLSAGEGSFILNLDNVDQQFNYFAQGDLNNISYINLTQPLVAKGESANITYSFVLQDTVPVSVVNVSQATTSPWGQALNLTLEFSDRVEEYFLTIHTREGIFDLPANSSTSIAKNETIMTNSSFAGGFNVSVTINSTSKQFGPFSIEKRNLSMSSITENNVTRTQGDSRGLEAEFTDNLNSPMISGVMCQLVVNGTVQSTVLASNSKCIFGSLQFEPGFYSYFIRVPESIWYNETQSELRNFTLLPAEQGENITAQVTYTTQLNRSFADVPLQINISNIADDKGTRITGVNYSIFWQDKLLTKGVLSDEVNFFDFNQELYFTNISLGSNELRIIIQNPSLSSYNETFTVQGVNTFITYNISDNLSVFRSGYDGANDTVRISLNLNNTLQEDVYDANVTAVFNQTGQTCNFNSSSLNQYYCDFDPSDDAILGQTNAVLTIEAPNYIPVNVTISNISIFDVLQANLIDSLVLHRNFNTSFNISYVDSLNQIQNFSIVGNVSMGESSSEFSCSNGACAVDILPQCDLLLGLSNITVLAEPYSFDYYKVSSIPKNLTVNLKDYVNVSFIEPENQTIMTKAGERISVELNATTLCQTNPAGTYRLIDTNGNSFVGKTQNYNIPLDARANIILNASFEGTNVDVLDSEYRYLSLSEAIRAYIAPLDVHYRNGSTLSDLITVTASIRTVLGTDILEDTSYNSTFLDNVRCNWYLNGEYNSTSSLNSSNECTYAITPSCNFEAGLVNITVMMNSTQELPYNFTLFDSGNTSTELLKIQDTNLTLSIVSPVDGQNLTSGTPITLEYDLQDTCGDPVDHTLEWRAQNRNLNRLIKRLPSTELVANDSWVVFSDFWKDSNISLEISGDYYSAKRIDTAVNVYQVAELSSILVPSYVTPGEIAQVNCTVSVNNNFNLSGYNVTFTLNNETKYNLTNESGFASYTFTSPAESGINEVSCAIGTDDTLKLYASNQTISTNFLTTNTIELDIFRNNREYDFDNAVNYVNGSWVFRNKDSYMQEPDVMYLAARPYILSLSTKEKIIQDEAKVSFYIDSTEIANCTVNLNEFQNRPPLTNQTLAQANLIDRMYSDYPCLAEWNPDNSWEVGNYTITANVSLGSFETNSSTTDVTVMGNLFVDILSPTNGTDVRTDNTSYVVRANITDDRGELVTENVTVTMHHIGLDRCNWGDSSDRTYNMVHDTDGVYNYSWNLLDRHNGTKVSFDDGGYREIRIRATGNYYGNESLVTRHRRVLGCDIYGREPGRSYVNKSRPSYVHPMQVKITAPTEQLAIWNNDSQTLRVQCTVSRLYDDLTLRNYLVNLSCSECEDTEYSANTNTGGVATFDVNIPQVPEDYTFTCSISDKTVGSVKYSAEDSDERTIRVSNSIGESDVPAQISIKNAGCLDSLSNVVNWNGNSNPTSDGARCCIPYANVTANTDLNLASISFSGAGLGTTGLSGAYYNSSRGLFIAGSANNHLCLNFTNANSDQVSVTVTAQLADKLNQSIFLAGLDSIPPSGECEVEALNPQASYSIGSTIQLVINTSYNKTQFSTNSLEGIYQVYASQGGSNSSATGELDSPLWYVNVTADSSAHVEIYAHDHGYNYMNGSYLDEPITCAIFTYGIDSEPPSISVFTASPNLTTTTPPFSGNSCSNLADCGVVTGNVTFNWDITDDSNISHVWITQGGSVVCEQEIYEVSNQSNCEIDLNQDTGSYIYSLYTNDTAGNINSTNVTVLVDNIVPSIENMTANVTKFSSFYIAAKDSVVNISANITKLGGFASFDPESDDNSTVWLENATGCINDCNPLTRSGDIYFSSVTVPSTEGTYQYYIFAKDNLSNYANRSINITIDTTLPNLSINHPLNGSVVGGIQQFKISANDTYGVSEVLYCIDDSNLCNPDIPITPIEQGIGSFSNDTRSINNGITFLRVSARDNAGNQRTVSANFTVDNTPPNIPMFTGYPILTTTTSPFTGDSCSNLEDCGVVTGNVTFNWTITDNVNISHFILRKGNSDKCSGTVFSNSNTSECSVNIDGTTGAVNYTLFINDTAGNSNSSNFTIFVDNSPPTITNFTTNITEKIEAVFLVAGGAEVNLSAQIVKTGGFASFDPGFDDNSKVWLENDTACINECDPITRSGDIYFSSVTAPTSGGTYQYHIFAKDNLSNYATLPLSITVDVVPPNVTIVSPANDSVLSGTRSFVISIEDTHGIKTKLYCDGDENCNPFIKIPDNKIIVYNTTTKVEGPKTLNVRVIDRVGNEANASANFKIDNTPPSVLITDPQNNTVQTTDFTINTTITDTHLNTSSIKVENNRVNGWSLSPDTSTSYLFSLTVSDFPEGVNIFNVSASDRADSPNTNFSLLHVIIDTKAPYYALTSPLNNSQLKGLQTFRFNATDDGSGINLTSGMCSLGNLSASINHEGSNMFNCTINTSQGTQDTLVSFTVNMSDQIGSVNTSTLASYYVDAIPPTFTHFELTPMQLRPGTNITITNSNAEDNIEIKECIVSYRVENSELMLISQSSLSSNCTGSFNFTPNIHSENVELHLTVIDFLNNSASVNKNISVDNTSPVIQNIVANVSGWITSTTPIQINATVTDSFSTIDTVRLNNSLPMTLNSNIYSWTGTASDIDCFSGPCNVSIFANDTVGNEVYLQSEELFSVDDGEPIFTSIQIGDNSNYSKNNTNHAFVITLEDLPSGVEGVTVDAGNGIISLTNFSATDWSGSVNISRQEIIIIARSGARTESQEVVYIVIDDIAPDLANFTYSPNQTYTPVFKEFNFSAEITDKINNGSSGIVSSAIISYNDNSRTMFGEDTGIYWNVTNLSNLGITNSGVYNLTLNVTDKAGNFNTSNLTLQVDALVPFFTSLTLDSKEINTSIIRNNVTSFNLLATASDNDSQSPASEISGVNVSVVNEFEMQEEEGDFTLNTNGSALGCPDDGECQLEFSAIDKAGNILFVNRTIIIDSNPPEIYGVTLNQTYVRNNSRILVNVNVSEELNNLTVNSAELEYQQNADGYIWSGSVLVNTSSLFIEAIDLANNKVNTTQIIHIDDVAPVIATISYNSSTNISNSRTTYLFSANVSDLISNGSAGKIVRVSIFGNDSSNGLTMTTSDNNTWSIEANFTQLGLVENGMFNFTILALDAAGNSNISIHHVTIDNAPPVVIGYYGELPLNKLSQPPEILPAISGTYDRVIANNSVNWKFNITDFTEGVVAQIYSSCNDTKYTLDKNDNVYNYTARVEDLGCELSAGVDETNFTVYMVAKDSVNNVYTYELNLTLIKQIPIINFDINPSNREMYEPFNATLNITSISLSTVEINVSGTVYQNITQYVNSELLLSKIPDSDDYIINHTIIPNETGSYNITVKATDTFGAVAILSRSFNSIGNTSGVFLVAPRQQYVEAPNATVTRNVEINFTLNNTNLVRMYNTSIKFTAPTGFILNVSENSKWCGTVSGKLTSSSTTCFVSVNATINNVAPISRNSVYAEAVWTNPDKSEGSALGIAIVSINDSTLFNVDMDLEDTITNKNQTLLGKINISNIGNTILRNVSISHLLGSNVTITPQLTNISPNTTATFDVIANTTVAGNYNGNFTISIDSCPECTQNESFSFTAYDYGTLKITNINSGTYNRTDLVNSGICQLNTTVGDAISDYSVQLTLENSSELIVEEQNITDENGVAILNLVRLNETPGDYIINCSAISLGFTEIIENTSLRVISYGALTLSEFTSSDSVLRIFDDEVPHNTTLTVAVIDEFDTDVSDVNVSFYSNATPTLEVALVGSCLTNATGQCSYVFNPNTTNIGNYTIWSNATKPYYYDSASINSSLEMNGTYSVRIQSPITARYYANTNITLDVSIKDSDGNNFTTTNQIDEIEWFMSNGTTYPVSIQDDKQFISTVLVNRSELPFSLGKKNLTVNVTIDGKAYTSPMVEIEIWDTVSKNITIDSAEIPRNSSFVITGEIKDGENPVPDYSCTWVYKTGNTEFILNSSTTNISGICENTVFVNESFTVGSGKIELVSVNDSNKFLSMEAHEIDITIRGYANISWDSPLSYSVNFSDIYPVESICRVYESDTNNSVEIAYPVNATITYPAEYQQQTIEGLYVSTRNIFGVTTNQSIESVNNRTIVNDSGIFMDSNGTINITNVGNMPLTHVQITVENISANSNLFLNYTNATGNYIIGQTNKTAEFTVSTNNFSSINLKLVGEYAHITKITFIYRVDLFSINLGANLTILDENISYWSQNVYYSNLTMNIGAPVAIASNQTLSASENITLTTNLTVEGSDLGLFYRTNSSEINFSVIVSNATNTERYDFGSYNLSHYPYVLLNGYRQVLVENIPQDPKNISFIYSNTGSDQSVEVMIDSIYSQDNIFTENGLAFFEWIAPIAGKARVHCAIADFDNYNVTQNKDEVILTIVDIETIGQEDEGIEYARDNQMVTSMIVQPSIIQDIAYINSLGNISNIEVRNTRNTDSSIRFSLDPIAINERELSTQQKSSVDIIRLNQNLMMLPANGFISIPLTFESNQKGIKNYDLFSSLSNISDVTLVEYKLKIEYLATDEIFEMPLLLRLLNYSVDAQLPQAHISPGDVLVVNYTLHIDEPFNQTYQLHLDKNQQCKILSLTQTNITCRAPILLNETVNPGLDLSINLQQSPIVGFTPQGTSTVRLGNVNYEDYVPPRITNFSTTFDNVTMNLSIDIFDEGGLENVSLILANSSDLNFFNQSFIPENDTIISFTERNYSQTYAHIKLPAPVEYLRLNLSEKLNFDNDTSVVLTSDNEIVYQGSWLINQLESNAKDESSVRVGNADVVWLEIPRGSRIVDAYLNITPESRKTRLTSISAIAHLGNNSIAIVDGSSLYVLESNTGEYTIRQKLGNQRGDSKDTFRNPSALHFTNSVLTVADQFNGRIKQYAVNVSATTPLSHLRSSVISTSLIRPNDITIGDFGFITNAINKSIIPFNPESLSLSSPKFIENDSSLFGYPASIASVEGQYFVLDRENSEIVRFTYNSSLNQYTFNDSAILSLKAPTRLRSFQDILVVIDAYNAKVQLINTTNMQIISTVDIQKLISESDYETRVRLSDAILSYDENYSMILADVASIIKVQSSDLSEWTFVTRQDYFSEISPEEVGIDVNNDRVRTIRGDFTNIDIYLNESSVVNLTTALGSITCEEEPNFASIRSYVKANPRTINMDKFGTEYCRIPIAFVMQSPGVIHISDIRIAIDKNIVLKDMHLKAPVRANTPQNATIMLTGSFLGGGIIGNLSNSSDLFTAQTNSSGRYVGLYMARDVANNTQRQLVYYDFSTPIQLSSVFSDSEKDILVSAILKPSFIGVLSLSDIIRSEEHIDGNLVNRTVQNISYDLLFDVDSKVLGISEELRQNVKISFIGSRFKISNNSVNESLFFDTFDFNSINYPTGLVSLPGLPNITVAGISVKNSLESQEFVEITFNYSEYLNLLYSQGYEVIPEELVIYRCADSISNCSSSDWEEVPVLEHIVESNVITFRVRATSSFIVAQKQADNVAPPGSPSSGGSGSGGGGGSAGGSGASTIGLIPDTPSVILDAVCGNNICELGENEYNCPLDCSLKPIEVDFSRITYYAALPGSVTKTYIELKSQINTTAVITFNSLNPELLSFFDFPSSVILEPFETQRVPVIVQIPANENPRLISGSVLLMGAGPSTRQFVTVHVATPSDLLFNIDAFLIRNILSGRQPVEIALTADNTIIRNKNVSISYTILRENETIFSTKDYVFFDQILNITKELSLINADAELRFLNQSWLYKFLNINAPKVASGDYILRLEVSYEDISTSEVLRFSVRQRVTEESWFIATVSLLLLITVLSMLLFVVHKYRRYRYVHSRYIVPNVRDLPGKDLDQIRLAVGYIGGTSQRAFLNAKDLNTHTLVAGSTGSGKSVNASIIVEEALINKIPVVVFDPTAQWTGFLSPLKDKNILKAYSKFKLTADDARGYRGLIFTPLSDSFDLEFKDYMSEGEVTIFNLSSLTNIQYNNAVKKIIDKMFANKWEESGDLKLLVVFDEVHRLLDPSVDGAGYEALTKACREFRKWGIGLIMASQVNSDFKEAIEGNVLTEVQLNTKNLEDIKKIEEKYGLDYASRIARQGVGVALVQQPRYNKGMPWFIEFRPPYHNPHKLPENDLFNYEKYTKQLEKIKYIVDSLRNLQQDVSDYELNYKLASSKLKEGKFKMVEIYMDELKTTLKKDPKYSKVKPFKARFGVDDVVNYIVVHMRQGKTFKDVVVALKEREVTDVLIKEAIYKIKKRK